MLREELVQKEQKLQNLRLEFDSLAKSIEEDKEYKLFVFFLHSK